MIYYILMTSGVKRFLEVIEEKYGFLGVIIFGLIVFGIFYFIRVIEGSKNINNNKEHSKNVGSDQPKNKENQVHEVNNKRDKIDYNAEADKLLFKAAKAEVKGKFEEATHLYQSVVNRFPGTQAYKDAKTQLEVLKKEGYLA